jgi:hypothetical protein
MSSASQTFYRQSKRNVQGVTLAGRAYSEGDQQDHNGLISAHSTAHMYCDSGVERSVTSMHTYNLVRCELFALAAHLLVLRQALLLQDTTQSCALQCVRHVCAEVLAHDEWRWSQCR